MCNCQVQKQYIDFEDHAIIDNTEDAKEEWEAFSKAWSQKRRRLKTKVTKHRNRRVIIFCIELIFYDNSYRMYLDSVNYYILILDLL